MDSKTLTIKYLGNKKYLIQTIGDCLSVKDILNKHWDDNLYGWVISDKDKFDFTKLYTELCKKSKICTLKKNLEKKIFNNMEFSKYGKGYLLCPKNGNKHPDWGTIGNKKTNYYHGGWWRNDLDGWFFRGSHLKTLISNGASEI